MLRVENMSKPTAMESVAQPGEARSSRLQGEEGRGKNGG